MVDKCEEHSGCLKDIDHLLGSDEEQWKHITNIENALPKLLPVWVTIVLMAMSAVTASSLTIAGMWVKFTGS